MTYSAPASCPNAPSWIDEVVSRVSTETRELARRELPALVESVEVTPDGKRALLRLRGAPSARVVHGESCSEVLAGAALIVAIAFGTGLEPEASTPQPSSTPEPSSTPQPASAPEAAIAPEPSAKGEVLELPEARPAPVRESDRGRADGVARDGGARPQASRPAAAPRWAIGASAGARTGLAPSPAGVVDGALELAWPDRGCSIRGRGTMGLARASVGERSARFLFIGGSFELCAVMLGTHLGWQWRSCLDLELGQVQAEGEADSALARADTHRTGWAAPGLVTRLQSPKIQGVRFELEGGISTPLWHREFEFHDPDVSVFQTPLLAMSARLGVQVPLE